MFVVFFFQAEDGIRDADVTGVQTCALPIFPHRLGLGRDHRAAGGLGAAAGLQVAAGLRAAGGRAPPAAALTEDPDAVVLLRQVDELEVDGEGACHQFGAVEVEPRHDADDPVELPSPIGAGAQLDGGVTQALYVGEQLRSPRFDQHLAEHAAEQAHVAAERGGRLLALDPGARGRRRPLAGRPVTRAPLSRLPLTWRAWLRRRSRRPPSWPGLP